MEESVRSSKVCFVTIGATAAFDSLLRAVLSQSFIEALVEFGYTDLQVQYGADGYSLFSQYSEQYASAVCASPKINITGFDFRKAGLGAEMGAARNGVVITHAGSGSVLDALRLAVPFVVVPNPSLLDNHQEELAEEMARQGYAVHGHLENLSNVLHHVESLRQRIQDWPPRNAGGDGRGLVGIMDDEMGFVD